MKIKLFMAVILAAVLSACATTNSPDYASSQNFGSFDSASSRNFGVSVEAKPAQGGVKVLSKAQGWNRNNKKNGYLGYAQGESGLTLFTVKKEDLSNSCAGTAEWVITRLQLATEGDEKAEKGSNFGQPQPAWLQEAFPDVDLSDGDLFNTGKVDGRTFLVVHNANQQEGYRFIYYKLTLSRCSDGYSITSDPGWGNGGRN